MQLLKNRILRLLLVFSAGVFIGTLLSTLMIFVHYPNEQQDLGGLFLEGAMVFLFSPLTMTLGIGPTCGFYGSIHGWLIFVGILLSVFSFFRYRSTGKRFYLGTLFLGALLWSNNNYLSFQAIMSV